MVLVVSSVANSPAKSMRTKINLVGKSVQSHSPDVIFQVTQK